MRLVKILAEDGNEQTFLSHLIIKFEKLDNEITALTLEFPLHETSYIAYMNDEKLIDAIYGDADDSEGDYTIIDCRPPDIRNYPEVVAIRPIDDSDGPSLGAQMDLTVSRMLKKKNPDDTKDDNQE